MSVPDLAYLAGIIDGEGSFTMEPRRRPNGLRARIPEITVASVDKELIDWLHDRCGGSVSCSKATNRKPMHRWVLRGSMCQEVTTAVKPYLVIERKKKRAEKLLTLKGSGYPRTKAEEEYLESFAQELFAI